MKVIIELTDAQEHTFTQCADAARVSLERWLLECAVVKAANVIDVLQEDERRHRAEVRALNASATAARARLPRQPRVKAAPVVESRILKAALTYNAGFRASKTAKTV